MRRAAAVLSIAVVTALVAGCTVGGSPGPSGPESSVIPGPSLPSGVTLDQGDLRLLLIDAFGAPWFCDPDQYPLARPSYDEGQTAIERFADMQAEGVVFNAVVRHLGLTGTTTFSDAQKLAIYRLWKQGVAVVLQSGAAGGSFAFDYAAAPIGGASTGVRTTGTIDPTGRIIVTGTEAADPPNCPICLARGTRIDGPNGPVAVERLAIGQAVWTLDLDGHRIAATVVALGSTIAPASHRVIQLVLADGRTVTASPGHPLADGRPLGSLRPGDVVDGSAVVSVTSLAYGVGRTYDLVVSGPTGIYLSDGIALRSTLR